MGGYLNVSVVSVEKFIIKCVYYHCMAKKDPIPKELFNILACPLCKSDLKYNKAKTKLICVKCEANYPIREGIPVLIPPKKK